MPPKYIHKSKQKNQLTFGNFFLAFCKSSASEFALILAATLVEREKLREKGERNSKKKENTKMANTLNILCQAVTPCPNSTSICSSNIKFSLSSKLSNNFPLSPSSISSSEGCRFSLLEECFTSHRNMSSNGRRQNHVQYALPPSSVEVASVKDLFDFICSGPLVNKLGLTAEKIAESIDKWLLCASQLCRIFQLNELKLSDAQKVRLYHYYIPVFLWCEDQISQHASKFKDGEDVPPVVIGFSAPQGCGKTTLVYALNYLFEITGRKSATISIDDFYLTAEGQAKLREENSGNRLLEFRGNAGSHDLSLSVETIEALSKLTKEGMKMKVPRYDKSAFNGRGDRADPSMWTEVEGPLTVILFEGWMLGFKPLPDEVVKAVDPQLEIVNNNLRAYYDAWDKYIDAWVVIKITDPSCVYQWRLQAEQAMRADGKSGMTDEEVFDFVSRYLPAYKAYLPTLYKEGPSGCNPKRTLVVEIDEGRNPILLV
ncbi:D-glycerate 3-kinase, chloroplastic isoform X3 [Amaranthus tricolor]|uniref:D-glycerate 3-kinase, chloroplastic isoform X3 n=1 Tax=Amaranthus tricolor TaxID=29722 RepID=UPI002587515D|nr:D-glycerate 3-kinase, chloroplastic isoform X3 [Amaranthus tricolor]